MHTSLKKAIKVYHSWQEVFEFAKPMKFNAFNTGRISGKLKTYTDTKSLPSNIDKNMVMEWDMMVFSFHHPKNGDVLIDCGFSKSFTDSPPFGNLSLPLKIFQVLNGIKYSQLPGEDFEELVPISKPFPDLTTNIYQYYKYLLVQRNFDLLKLYYIDSKYCNEGHQM